AALRVDTRRRRMAYGRPRSSVGAVPRRRRHAAARARSALDRAAAALGREHRLQAARRRHDALSADPGRRRAAHGRRLPRRAGRRRGVRHRDRVPARARDSHARAQRPRTALAGRAHRRCVVGVRLRRGPRYGGRACDRDDARPDGARARHFAQGSARARERLRRPARDAGRQRRERHPRHTPRVSYEFKLPDLGEGLTEGEIARWLVAEGQEIAEDDPLVEIATDKTTAEIPSPAAGTVTKIFVGEGEVVPVWTVLVVIGGDAAAAANGERPVPATAAPKQVPARATPLVRRLAKELGVDVDSLAGSGPQGRITEQDVRAAAGPKEGRREPLRGVKRQMFEHLTKAHAVPTVTWVEECDFSGVDLKLLVPLVLKACAASLQEFPELNARV